MAPFGPVASVVESVVAISGAVVSRTEMIIWTWLKLWCASWAEQLTVVAP